MEEKLIGLEARSNDYMDGLSDMILFLQAHDLSNGDERERMHSAIGELEAFMNAVRQSRFIEENGLARFCYKSKIEDVPIGIR